MTMHLQKLCVGVKNVEDLQAWIDFRRDQAKIQGWTFEQFHTTRSMPKQRDAILDGGSLYWVIKGVMQARQHIVDLRAVVGSDGISRCDIVLEPRIILTEMRPKRPFQGWRYLKANEAPADQRNLSDGEGELPAEMRKELAELGLI
ncbi:MAG: DUF1489 domain-containing protein [Hyphomicrobiales bacterium]